jgi:hypothetical protein
LVEPATVYTAKARKSADLTLRSGVALPYLTRLHLLPAPAAEDVGTTKHRSPMVIQECILYYPCMNKTELAGSVAGGLFWLAVAGWLLHSCFYGQTPPQSAPSKRTPVEKLLDDCTPFQTLDDHRTLAFYVEDHSVIESAKETSSADGASEKKGVWLADEETHRLSIDIDGFKSEFSLMMLLDYDLCVLLAGSVSDADLTKSLFAQPYIPGPDE